MKILLLLYFAFCAFSSFAQKIENLNSRQPNIEFENVHVEQLATDSLCTSFLIWIKTGVNHHFHAFHSENIYVLEGTGTMTWGESTFEIQSGDFVLIPEGIVHSLVAKTPVKVLSVQTPQWTSEDRKFVTPFRRPHNE